MICRPPREFILDNDAHGEEWRQFGSSQSARAPFNETQQAVILANDAMLRALFDELVPGEIDVDRFWGRWRFWQYRISQTPARPTVDRAEYEEKDSTSLDAVNISPAAGEEEWDSWE